MKEKILLALSDNNLSNVLEKQLQDNGFEIFTSKDGNDVLEKMKSEKPDLVLIDINLSGKNGYDVLQEKSFDRFITKIPVIIVSNSSATLEMKRIPSTPTIKDYLVKTHIEPNEVIVKLKKVLENIKNDTKEIVQASPSISGNGKKVLWVEDDKLLSNILSKKFQKSGFILLKAINGEEAFSILDKEMPNIIILDILLPGMNGLDILQKIKTEERFRKIPVIILSNMSKQSDIDKAKLLGAQKFIVKAAVSLDEIIKEVSDLVN